MYKLKLAAWIAYLVAIGIFTAATSGPVVSLAAYALGILSCACFVKYRNKKGK